MLLRMQSNARDANTSASMFFSTLNGVKRPYDAQELGHILVYIVLSTNFRNLSFGLKELNLSVFSHFLAPWITCRPHVSKCRGLQLPTVNLVFNVLRQIL